MRFKRKSAPLSFFNALEWHSNGEMEGQVPAQAGMDDGIMCLFLFKGGINGLHTQVEAQDEVVEVQAQTHAVANGDVIKQTRELELTARLVLIVAQGPDVTGIQEHSPRELPK